MTPAPKDAPVEPDFAAREHAREVLAKHYRTRWKLDGDPNATDFHAADEMLAALRAGGLDIVAAGRPAAPSDGASWRGLCASEAACYKWPADTDEHKALRAAYIDGAVGQAAPQPTWTQCPGCDGHECETYCNYPGVAEAAIKLAQQAAPQPEGGSPEWSGMPGPGKWYSESTMEGERARHLEMENAIRQRMKDEIANRDEHNTALEAALREAKDAWLSKGGLLLPALAWNDDDNMRVEFSGREFKRLHRALTTAGAGKG